MTSAFAPASCDERLVSPRPCVDPKNDTSLDSETEDEEVKMTCIGGFRGVEDSDMNTTDDENIGGNEDDEDEDDYDDTEDEPERNQGVVTFVAQQVHQCPVVRPKATSPYQRKLSTHEEGDNESQSSTSTSSIGARGVPLSLGTPSAMSEASHEDDESEPYVPGVTYDNEKSDSESSSCSSDGGDGDEEDGEDGELSSILGSLGERGEFSDTDTDETTGRFIGVMEDRNDLITVPSTKRVLSFNTLAALNAEAGLSPEFPKRRKSGENRESLPILLPTSFSIGPSAMAQDLTVTKNVASFRKASPPISSSDDEALDRQLCEELAKQGEGDSSRTNTPVALLTPPHSPLTIEVDGEKTTVCEWPSNLAVDSAMTAAINEIRPMSPESLQHFEQGEESRVAQQASSEASTLTPLLRGIYVG